MKDSRDDFFDPSAEKAGIATFESAALATSDDRELVLDYNGLPLIPQPSRFKDDPLVRLHSKDALTKLHTYIHTY